MAVDRPPILVSPREFPVDPDSMFALSEALFAAQPGQVLHAAFPVQIYHLIDGLWIESGDLPNVLTKANSVEEMIDG